MVSLAPIVQANLAAVGINVTISTMEIPRYWEEVWGPSKFDMTTMYWVSPLADPDDFVFNNYACNTPINVQKSCSDAMDALLREAKSGASQAVRKDAYLRQQQLSLDEMPIVPLVNAWVLTAHTERLKNYVPMRTGFLKTLKDSWLET
jgi:peptide/nickel transport system substrate-binding protein